MVSAAAVPAPAKTRKTARVLRHIVRLLEFCSPASAPSITDVAALRPRARATMVAYPGDPMPRKRPEELRSHRWYGARGRKTFDHRSRSAQMGYDKSDYAGKPVIAVINTWSDINPSHAHFRSSAEEAKRGVWQAGGFPVEMPAIALAEPFQKPSTMMYRNFLAMETEELLRSYPADGCVLMGGCDKTTPALVMGALSMGLPMIYLPAGPMLRGNWHGQVLGSGSDSRKRSEEHTSELQSLAYLVCRLLLEKKKKIRHR